MKIGDIVMLKSGSSEMTITEISGDTAVCTWAVLQSGEMVAVMGCKIPIAALSLMNPNKEAKKQSLPPVGDVDSS